ncbi:14701_t:CDS:2, partial [Cetraspora pellucida]
MQQDEQNFYYCSDKTKLKNIRDLFAILTALNNFNTLHIQDLNQQDYDDYVQFIQDLNKFYVHDPNNLQ